MLPNETMTHPERGSTVPSAREAVSAHLVSKGSDYGSIWPNQTAPWTAHISSRAQSRRSPFLCSGGKIAIP